jgi:hypothetical protein
MGLRRLLVAAFAAWALTASACYKDPRSPDYVPTKLLPTPPNPPMSAGGGPRPKAPEKQPAPETPAPVKDKPGSQ